MAIFDIALIVILSFFVFYGLFFGMIRVVGSLFGIILGAYVASRYYLWLFEWIPVWFGYENLGKVISFIIIFSIINRLSSIIFLISDKAFSLFMFLPFAKTTNSILGGILSFVEGTLIIGLFIYVAAKYAYVGNMFGDMLIESQLAPYFIKFNKVLMPLFPEAIKAIKSLI